MSSRAEGSRAGLRRGSRPKPLPSRPASLLARSRPPAGIAQHADRPLAGAMEGDRGGAHGDGGERPPSPPLPPSGEMGCDGGSPPPPLATGGSAREPVAPHPEWFGAGGGVGGSSGGNRSAGAGAAGTPQSRGWAALCGACGRHGAAVMSGLLRGGGAHRRARRVSFIRGLRLPKVVNERCLLVRQWAGWVPISGALEECDKKVFLVNRLSAQGVDL